MRHPVPQMVAHWLVIYHTKWYIYPFPHKKTTIFHSVHTFTHIRQHYFSKYWGDQCMCRPPTSNFGGDRPPKVSAPAYFKLNAVGASKSNCTICTERLSIGRNESKIAEVLFVVFVLLHPAYQPLPLLPR